MRTVEEWGRGGVGPTAARARNRWETVKRLAAAATRVNCPRCRTRAPPAMVDGATCTSARRIQASYARRSSPPASASWGVLRTRAGPHPQTSPTVARCSLAREVATLEAPARAKEARRPFPRGRRAPRAQARQEIRGVVELDPPKGRPGRIVDRASTARRTRSTSSTWPTGPGLGADERQSCAVLTRTGGDRPDPPYTCRDRNLPRHPGPTCRAYALGLRNILAITGDPPKGGLSGRDRRLRRRLDRPHQHHGPPSNHGCDRHRGQPSSGPPWDPHRVGADPSNRGLDKRSAACADGEGGRPNTS